MGKAPERRIFLKEYKAISRALSTYEDFSLLTAHLVEGLCTSFKIKACSLLLYDDREKELFHISSYGLSQKYLDKGTLVVDEQYSSFMSGKPIFVEDLQTNPHVQYPQAAAEEGLVSMLSVPIKTRSQTIGSLRIYNDEPWTVHADDIESFCSLSEHLGLVIENNGLRNFLDHVKGSLSNLPLRMLGDL